MTQPLAPPASDSDVEGRAVAPSGPPGTPRWVKLLGVVGLIAVLLVAAVVAFGGGQHGPGMHGPGGGAGSPTTPTSSLVRGPKVTHARYAEARTPRSVTMVAASRLA
jgi:hypothetical protein